MTGTVRMARKARRYGARYAWTIIREARRARLPISLGFALIEQESNFSNVYGHDPVDNPAPKGGKVTRWNYRHIYLPSRRHGAGMQGVGPAQLTWYEYQDLADNIGGCHRPKYNIRVAFTHLAELVRTYGTQNGIARYNGTGPLAQNYAEQVRWRARRWHLRLR